MLKKIALTVAALGAMAGISFALTNPDFIENVPGINFKTSTNVKCAYTWDATSTTPQNYSIVSKHSSGDTYYATSNKATAIMKQKVDAKLGVALTLADTQVTTIPAGDSLFASYSPM